LLFGVQQMRPRKPSTYCRATSGLAPAADSIPCSRGSFNKNVNRHHVYLHVKSIVGFYCVQPENWPSTAMFQLFVRCAATNFYDNCQNKRGINYCGVTSSTPAKLHTLTAALWEPRAASRFLPLLRRNTWFLQQACHLDLHRCFKWDLLH